MPGGCTPASVAGLTLLERAISYTLGSLHLATAGALGRPTPCPDWDLRALLVHLDDGLLALAEAVDTGRVDVEPAGAAGGDLIAGVRGRARDLLRACAAGPAGDLVRVGDATTTGALVAGTGAIEITVHGWDVARAAGRHHPLPRALAGELLDLAPLLVTRGERPGRFGRPVPVPATAGPGERLLAFLGRDPG
jgi:uncharacterized protein (TIGR03086 family)